MNKKKVLNLLLVTFVILCFAVFGLTWVWAHGEETNIIPESLNVKAGSQLKVTVNGLVGTKTATFTLTGMFGKFELGHQGVIALRLKVVKKALKWLLILIKSKYIR
jgi:hypothetical protein